MAAIDFFKKIATKTKMKFGELQKEDNSVIPIKEADSKSLKSQNEEEYDEGEEEMGEEEFEEEEDGEWISEEEEAEPEKILPQKKAVVESSKPAPAAPAAAPAAAAAVPSPAPRSTTLGKTDPVPAPRQSKDEDELGDDEEWDSEEEEEEEWESEEYTDEEVTRSEVTQSQSAPVEKAAPSGQAAPPMTASGDAAADDEIRDFEVTSNWKGEERDDLSIKKGEILKIVKTSENGWWLARNENGKEGYVPSNYLKVYIVPDAAPAAGEEGGSSEKKEPRERWKEIKKAVQEKGVSDILKAFGALPAGFRVGTLGRIEKTEVLKRLEGHLLPKLAPSSLAFGDMSYNPAAYKIRLRNVKFQRILQLQKCIMVPSFGSQVEVVVRHVRICLFDGKKVYGNIHTVKVSSVDKEEKQWMFSNKVSDNMKSGEYAELFVRTNSEIPDLGILIEVCAMCLKTSTQEETELSVGWVFLPLVEENGQPVANKNFDLQLNGGTPYEKGVDVDPSIARTAGASKLKSLLTGNRQPRIQFKLYQPNKDTKDMLDTLPDLIVSNLINLPFLSLYRMLLADALLRDRNDSSSSEPLHNPLLSQFPKLVNQDDLMDIMRVNWLEKQKSLKRVEKKDNETLKNAFQEIFMNTVYPISCLSNLPKWKFGTKNITEVRQAQIQKFLAKKKTSIRSALLSPDIEYSPLTYKELIFDSVGVAQGT